MHPYALTPLLALLLGSALAGAVMARGSRMSASSHIAAMLVCSCGWALCELMAALASEPGMVLFWLRCLRLFTLAFGPLALLTVGELRPQHRLRCRRLAWLAVLVAVPASLLTLATPWFVAEALPPDVPSRYGYRAGPAAPLLLLLEACFPFYAIWLLVRTPADRRGPSLPTMRPVVGLALALPLLIGVATNVVLPQHGYAVPRLGSLTVVLFGVWFWLASFWPGEGAISDSGFARAILDDLHDGVAVLRGDGCIRSVNASLARLLDCEATRLIGRPIECFLGSAARGDERLQEREATLRAESGAEIPVAVSIQPLHDRQGGVIGRVLIARDLRPVQGLRRQLVASGRLAAVGELAAGIAHEVNNPIAFIQSNLNQLRHEYEQVRGRLGEQVIEADEGERLSQLLELGPEHIERALEEIARVAAIVREVRGFAHAGTGRQAHCDLDELVDGVLRLATLGLPRSIEIEREYGDVPPLACCEQDLKQVLLSLIRRAALSASEGGRIRVRTSVEGDRALVVIEDSASAAPPAESAGGDWNGLELGSCHHLLEQQGGELVVERRLDRGSRASVRLPLELAEVPRSEPGVGAAAC